MSGGQGSFLVGSACVCGMSEPVFHIPTLIPTLGTEQGVSSMLEVLQGTQREGLGGWSWWNGRHLTAFGMASPARPWGTAGQMAGGGQAKAAGVGALLLRQRGASHLYLHLRTFSLDISGPWVPCTP